MEASITKVGNYGAVGYSLEAGLGESTEYVLMHPSRDNSLLVISTSSPDPTELGFQDLLDQILSTFQFIEDIKD